MQTDHILKSIMRILFNNKCEVEAERNRKREWREGEWQKDRLNRKVTQPMGPGGVLLVLSGLLGHGSPMKHGVQWVNICSGMCGNIQVPLPEWVRFTLSFETLGPVHSSGRRHPASHRPRPWNIYSHAKWKNATSPLFSVWLEHLHITSGIVQMWSSTTFSTKRKF